MSRLEQVRMALSQVREAKEGLRDMTAKPDAGRVCEVEWRDPATKATHVCRPDGAPRPAVVLLDGQAFCAPCRDAFGEIARKKAEERLGKGVGRLPAKLLKRRMRKGGL